ncbi:MAG: PQQ-dependent dehydrogenase, methanol/ethanol family [Bryobacterales bacterium]|nr:PQQ-dependent dehydrogenase, methanol/ethanol family [Bryobacterales bacterium]MDE0293846.1 PQQ-dependent dehydrogenase, methanol/ethanol family [Bryobacterales bacterium]
MKSAAILPAALICAQFAIAQVPYERLRNADQEPGSWLTYSGAYHGQRFSKLDQISTGNVADLRAVWVYQVEGSGEIETTPLVADGVMYVTELEARVTALDVRTGRPLWTYQHAMPEGVLNIGFGRTNRGGALLDETFYFGTLDAHLVALDAKSGALRWKTKVAENKLGYSITAAPLAIGGKIIVGISGGEAGIRGFLDAYDAETGERAWRSHTIPAPGEPGNDTWGGDSWKTGAGATWLTGSYDPELDLLYWGTGNPGPDWNGDARPGDNLYTCSLLAIEAPTGKLRWHFQFTPHDVHDWDSNQIPVLIDMPLAGKPRKLVAFANRNAFYYLLDRETGEFLLGTEYSTQTWAKGIGKTGRPILLPDKEPTVDGNLVYPSLQGATNWMSPSYSPVTKLLYVPVREMGSYYFKGEAKYEPGKVFVGGGERRLDGDKAWGSVRALRADSGERVWDFRTPSPLWTGVMATAGGLVFGGSNEGNFYALDASTGEPLWDFQTGGIIRSNPISFLVDGKQYVATSGGRAYYVFALP